MWSPREPFKRYQDWLVQQIDHLDKLGLAVCLQSDKFEKLEANNPKLYSIRYNRSQKNLRCIFMVYEGNYIILSCFLEKNTSDYKENIKLAQKRYKKLLSG